MSIQVAIRHLTRYRYDRLVALGPQTIRLRPAPHCRTPILSYSLSIKPDGHFLNWQQDPHGNFQARVVVPEKTRAFEVLVDVIADLAVINPFDFFLEPEAETWPFAYDPVLAEELAPFRKLASPGPLLAARLDALDKTPRRTIDLLVELNQALSDDIAYVIRLEPGVQTPEETLKLAKGSCRDTGWLLVHMLRHLGFAARFVSGYLVQLTPDERPLDGPAGPTHDFTDLHAWAEVYLPGAGWVGLDPTSGLFAGEGHIPLAASPEPQSAAPISGGVDESEVEFDFEMTVTRVRETPRVTKPYDEETWARILSLGGDIDAILDRSDVRLTMGGEPTFVSIDDRDGAEWNTDALGPKKRTYAGRLIRRLKDRLAPGALLHYGQGKWYPGESLPRWALNCFWRLDDVPLWRNPYLLASDDDKGRVELSQAERFMSALGERLRVDTDHVKTAYEDIYYYLWRERRLPVNVDPLKSNLADPEERRRLERVFRQGLNDPTGFVLPLTRNGWGAGAQWASGPWFVRDETLYLTPGDSPIGFRLPADSLPWSASGDYAYHFEEDPTAPRPRLPVPDRWHPAAIVTQSRTGPAADADAQKKAKEAIKPPPLGTSAKGIIRTALCVEPRNGLLHVFFPPLTSAADYIDLAAAVEDTAEALGQKVIIEGYTPPYDPRLGHFSVTPDPGVIEVNIHPSGDFKTLVERTQIIYDEAKATRLGAEKFMIDGRHVGTGGGNHMVMGGATPIDSPFLRRPDLLKSLIGYWQNHPSLSYLFSGLFIGPTSQHPRVDEARDDALHELDIAFSQIAAGEASQPWLIDRILRNVLVDVTGNTHRTEFCIDKLYSPDNSSGRRGLLELRAFEMPPHPRMSITQQLFLRAMIARFWNQPYDQPLVRWGNRLHDEFMLPHFAEQDFNDVIEDLNRAGYAFDPAWFAPHFEFRFPLIGEFDQKGLEVELRHALEPWHVMGEEGTAGGTVRYVDSSLERMQIKVQGLVDERHVIAVNGRALPLRATGRAGEYVAGVRFKAWAPASALHPTVPIHTPLAIDLYDTWSQRSLGGATYHVMHPGGRNYDTLPVNANEAEARRRSRFMVMGHTPGPSPTPIRQIDREMPLTLDLRRPVMRRS
jgi:uncharacterized protein (DUF2126 family)/transglutaminase-like putative cysteine protease